MCTNYVKTVLHALYSFKILTAEAFFAPKALRFGLFSKDITGSEKDEGEVEFFFCTKCGKKFNTEYTFSAVFAAVHWRKTQFHQLFNGLFSHQKLFSKLSG